MHPRKWKGKTVLIVLCIDRFLACHKKGVNFIHEDIEEFFKSWEKSSKGTKELFELAKGMPLHETKKTLSLNEARNFIVVLSKPMGEAVELIDKNSKEIEKVKALCKADDNQIQKFQERLHFKGFERKRNNLTYPITVCTHKDCTKQELIGHSKHWETIYKQICHEPCSLKGVPVETTNNEQLRGCFAMDTNAICKFCKHGYRDHMHMTYTTSLVEKTFLSDDVQKEINALTSVKDKKEKFIAELEKGSKEYEEEKETLYKCASHFGAFLKQNAMIAYNDSFSEYLDMLIKDEKEKKEVDEDRIAQLMKDKRTYEEKKQIIIKETSSPGIDRKVLPIEMIYEMRDELCSLKHNGNYLKEALGTVHFSKS